MICQPNRIITSGCVLGLLFTLFTACEKKLDPAVVEIIDPIRHYYPVVQGEMLGVTYEIENTSDNALFIQEVQTTCGCVVPSSDLPIVVLPKRRGYLRLSFNSIKNTGYVCHYVWCYGNFADSTWRELQFDTNVVPSADYIRDYEQLWQEKATHTGSMANLVDGDSSEKGYYTDDGVDPRERNRQNIQDAADDLAF